jgi:hypothetical protein
MGDRERLTRLSAALEEPAERARLLALLPEADVDALITRVERLLARGTHPFPSPDWPAVPWPPL